MKYVRPAVLLVALLAGAGWLETARAQDLTPRFGVGLNTMLSTADGFGLGFRGRASAPVNADLSLAVDLGFTGFVLEGRRNATYVFDPQASAILTLPYRPSQVAYMLFGIGAYVPLGDDVDREESGPFLHAGIGWVHQLNETSLFYEFDPALVIGESSVEFVFPFRLGFIF